MQYHQQQPLALCVRYGARCLHLVTQAGCSASPLSWGFLSRVPQLGVLYGQSGKFESIAMTDETHLSTLKPLRPRWWTVWNTAIRAVFGQYEWELDSLVEMAKCASETASTASGLFEHFSEGKTVLGLTLASLVLGDPESLDQYGLNMDSLSVPLSLAAAVEASSGGAGGCLIRLRC
ncbi:hypothetical protein DPEC_G00275730 [Dallia pectoralis]|uniref:Uncharacterized protein n=1 Tax=Dallia pectoralis TaxID=75939 RepID=A0ACC2FL70_DALPE|nr:hypothetical protein DPEC_G00275730 [Dallia pectoralis]